MTEAVGTLADEAAKLFTAAESWWKEHAPAAAPGTAHAGPECRVCPFCQLLHVVRGAQPELFEHVAEAATSLFAAVKGAVEAQQPQRHRDEVPVERIDIA